MNSTNGSQYAVEPLLDTFGRGRVGTERKPREIIAGESGVVPERGVMSRQRSHRGERIVTVASCYLIGSTEVTDVLHDEHEVVRVGSCAPK